MSSFKFLLGIIVLQIATTVLVVTALTSGPYLPLAGVFALIIGLLVALWFGSIADHITKDALVRAKERFSRERERLLATAEADKRGVIEKSHKQIVKETRRAHARANFKLGAAFAGMVSLGALMLSIQFLTIGLLILAAAGGGFVGYLVRAREESLALRNRTAQAVLARPYTEKLIRAEVVRPAGAANLAKKSS